jgi:predicted TIM-barrel fold metal-dependent hydrolase
MKRESGRQDVPPAPSVVSKSFELFLQEAHAAGVSRALVVGRRARPPFGAVDNDELVGIVRSHPSLFVACPALDLMDATHAIAEVERFAHDPAVRAFHVEPAWAAKAITVADRRLLPIYEALEHVGKPLIVTMGGHLGLLDQMDPTPLSRVAADFPRLTLVLGHGGWPFVMQAIGLAFAHPNVFLAPDMYLNIPDLPASMEYVRAANSFLRDRLVYGSAYPARPLEASASQFRSLPFHDGVHELVGYVNAERLFGP